MECPSHLAFSARVLGYLASLGEIAVTKTTLVLSLCCLILTALPKISAFIRDTWCIPEAKIAAKLRNELFWRRMEREYPETAVLPRKKTA
jgi:hypothetical protein